MAKGVSANMLKTSSKRRRTRKEIQDEKEAIAREKLETQAKLAQFDQLQQQIQVLQQENETGKVAARLMSQAIN